MLALTLFTYGFFAACAGLLFQIFFLVLFGEEASVLTPSLIFLLAAAFTEEAAKLIFLLQAFRRFGDLIFRLVHLVSFGIGFALLEIAFAFFMNPSDMPPLPLLTFNALLHIGTSVVLGFALKRFSSSRLTLLCLLLGVTLLHSLYNLFRLQTP